MRPRPDIPRHIACGADGTIVIAWRSGRDATLRARDLRLRCPCAHCVDEVTRRPLLDPATVPADVHARDWRPVGNYAVQFLWSDGHRTGLYPHALLRAATDDAAAAGAVG